jgi:hypothetical protein
MNGDQNNLIIEDENVICIANSYIMKYYINKMFDSLPREVKYELKITLVSLAEEVGGVITLMFDDDGQVSFGINHEEEDYLFDDISAGLISKKILSDKKDLFEQIEVYNKAIKLLREQEKHDK